MPSIRSSTTDPGLSQALLYQIAMNGTRIGCHPSLKRLLGANLATDGDLVFTLKSWCAGGVSGALGALLGNPLGEDYVQRLLGWCWIGEGGLQWSGVEWKFCLVIFCLL